MIYDDQCASNGEQLRVLVARIGGGVYTIVRENGGILAPAPTIPPAMLPVAGFNCPGLCPNYTCLGQMVAECCGHSQPVAPARAPTRRPSTHPSPPVRAPRVASAVAPSVTKKLRNRGSGGLLIHWLSTNASHHLLISSFADVHSLIRLLGLSELWRARNFSP